MTAADRRLALVASLAILLVGAVVWWRWLLFYAYPIMHGNCTELHVTAQTAGSLGADEMVVLVMNLDRSKQRLRVVSEELARERISGWVRVPGIDKWTEVPSLHTRRRTTTGELVGRLLHGWRPLLIQRLFDGATPTNDSLVRAIEHDWAGKPEGHYIALTFTFLRALAQGLELHEKRTGRTGGPGWLLIVEDDLILRSSFRTRLAETARRLPRSDLIWLDHRAWSRAWWYGEPACCTVGMLVRVEAAPRIARMMLPGSAQVARYLARRSKPPLYDLVLSYLCVSEGLCCTVHDLMDQSNHVSKTR